MSHKKIQQLADKFADTTLLEHYQSQKNKSNPFSGNFLKNLRIALNELEGDLVTLKHRDFNRSQWKELGIFWRSCIEIYKSFNENNPFEGIQELVELLKEKKDWLAKMIPAIRQHLKNTEIDFIPSPGLTQARADGLKELIRVVQEGAQNIKNDRFVPEQSETWKPPSSESTLVGTSPKKPFDKTVVETVAETPIAREELRKKIRKSMMPI